MRMIAFSAMTILAMLVSAAHAGCPKTGGLYSVRIDSAPQGAQIYIGDKSCQVGVTPWDGKLEKGDYTVIIETPGYEPASRPFKVEAVRRTQVLFVTLVKKAEPQKKIDIHVDADPKGVAGAMIMLDGEVRRDLRTHHVDLLTVGQYLPPSPNHLPIARYYTPAEFAEIREIANHLGFIHVESGPLVRSSYYAGRGYDAWNASRASAKSPKA